MSGCHFVLATKWTVVCLTCLNVKLVLHRAGERNQALLADSRVLAHSHNRQCPRYDKRGRGQDACFDERLDDSMYGDVQALQQHETGCEIIPGSNC